MDVLRVFIDVSERQAGAVRVGQLASIELDALPGHRFEGKVVRLSPAFDPTTRTLEAEVRIANPKGELRPGMYGRCAIVLDTHPGAIVIPASAMQVSGGKRIVFKVDKDRVKRVAVDIGVDGGNWLEVAQGLAPGDEIVIAGWEGLADGSPVRPVRDVDPFTGEKLVEKVPAQAGGTH
jgi:membrane fusion protein (multidrug efflux system)